MKYESKRMPKLELPTDSDVENLDIKTYKKIS